MGSNPTSGIAAWPARRGGPLPSPPDVRPLHPDQPESRGGWRRGSTSIGRFEIDDRPRFNIAPTDPVIAVRRSESGAANEAGVLRWGLVPGVWASEKGQRPLINARAETVREPAGVPGVVRASGAA